jgi:hypothetical protein
MTIRYRRTLIRLGLPVFLALLGQSLYAEGIANPAGAEPTPLPRLRPEPPDVSSAPVNVTFNPWPLDSKLAYCAKEKTLLSEMAAQGPTEITAEVVRKVLANPQVPEEDFLALVKTFNANSERIKNRKYVTIAKLSTKKSYPRFYVINTETGEVEIQEAVSHGSKSDLDKNGKVEDDDFSNKDDSHRSSCGYMMTGMAYRSKKYTPSKALHIHGTQAGLNDNACGRAIMAHAKANAGNKDTWGCFGLPPNMTVKTIEKIQNWSMIYVPCHAD